MPQTPLQYYSDVDNYGNYQYVKLKDVIDEVLLETQDDDSLIKNTKRSKIIKAAFRGVRELTRNVANDVKAFEITVPDYLYWPLPQNYVNWVRISVVIHEGSTFRLYPLDINYNINTAIGYLQDHEGKLLFDNDGNILQAESSNALAHPYKTYTVPGCYNPTKDTSKLSKYGEFTIDERRGIIVFSSNLMDKEVVIEYVSDGLDETLTESEITIHKHIREALYDFIIQDCVATKRNVSRADKTDLRNRWLSSRHKAAMARADFDIYRISRAMRAGTKIL